MGVGFVPTWLRQVSPHLFHETTLTTGYTVKWGHSQWLKWSCEAGGAHLTKPGWSKPHTHSHPTNLALFRQKLHFIDSIRGLILLQRGSNRSRGGGLRHPGPLTLTTGHSHTPHYVTHLL